MPTLTKEHKKALAEGRDDSRVVKAYLEALSVAKPRRGRKRTVESVRRRLAEVEGAIVSAPPLTALHLAQERLDLESDLASREKQSDMTAVESAFVKVAKRYAERKGLSYAAWREAGVAPDVLRKAGITSGS